MSRNLHLIVQPDKAAGQTFASKDGRLLLRRAEAFEVAVREYEEAVAPLNKEEEEAVADYNKKRAALEKGGWTADEIAAVKKDHAAYEKRQKTRNEKRAAATADFADVRWEWCTVGRGLHLAQNSINPAVAKGPARRFIQFPKVLEGGGYAWVEAFHESVGPTGKAPFGCYVAATGTPNIIAGEWKDAERKKIEKVVAFGSIVSLHIYTEGLYGQDIEIQLMDNDRVAAAMSVGITDDDDELPPYERTGGYPNPGSGTEEKPMPARKTFARAVGVSSCAGEAIPAKAVQGPLVEVRPGAPAGVPYVQRCVVKVYIDPLWRADGGNNLLIYPIVRHPGIPKPVVLDGCVLRVRYDEKEMPVVQSELTPTGNTPVRIGEVERHVEAFRPCRYEAITLSDTDSHGAPFRKKVYEAKTMLGVGELEYETVAPSTEGKARTLEVEYTDFEVTECRRTEHRHTKVVTVVQEDAPPEKRLLQGNTLKLPLQAKADFGLLRAHPELFFWKPDPVVTYKLTAETCAQAGKTLTVRVYPAVEREVAFLLTLFDTRSYEIEGKKMPRENLSRWNADHELKLVPGEMMAVQMAKGGLGFGLAAKVKVDNVESSVELGTTRSQIKRIVEFFLTVKTVLEPFDGRGKEHTSKARKGTYLKASFDIEPPNVALALRMTNRKLEKSDLVVRHFTTALALKPITRLKVGVDILTLVKYFGVAGKITDWLKRELEDYYKVDLYILLEFTLEARGEFNFQYNKIEGLSSKNLRLQVEVIVAVKVGIKSRKLIPVTVVNADGSKSRAVVEEFKAEGGAAASVLYTYLIDHDSKGKYSEHKLEFTGAKATIAIYRIRDRMQYDEYLKKEFTLVEKPDKPWYKSGKEYDDGSNA